MGTHQREKEKQAQDLQTRSLELKTSEEALQALKSESAAQGSQIEAEKVCIYVIV